MEGLQQLGHQVVRLRPNTRNLAPTIGQRLHWNLGLPSLLASERPDLVVGIDFDGFYWSSFPRTVKFVVSIKGVLAEEALRETGKWRWALSGLAQLEKWNAWNADLVLITSRYCQNAVERHYGIPSRRLKIVPEGLNLPKWQKAFHDCSYAGNGRTILCVARQYRRKRIQDLLYAMKIVAKKIPGATAIIVGYGPEHANLKRIVANENLFHCVRLLGGIADPNDVARLYRQADVFCLPSVQEGFGIVFLEAMACGLPIVSTTACAIPEVVPHQSAGLLVQPGDVGGLSNALIMLLANPTLRKEMGTFGMEWVRPFDWLLVAEQFLEAIDH